eukprot:TRINITY_DN841_c0_g1_i1.p1 TRINITY_DN841_c0_g1~~TRINITY_DN841_c0_g1_i1.p1  ORF type:complete len:245 (+),score=59.95 TRINITY_DN841_c0_g1_i1:43-777(+)
MKFRFIGDLDAPEWLLSEVSVLSKLSSVRMILVCRQIVDQLLGHGVNYDKIKKLTTGKRLHFESGDVKAIIASLHFILRNSAKYNVDDTILLDELQQMGLPRDIATSIQRCYRTSKEKLRKQLETEVLRFPKLDSVDWRVDYLMSSSTITKLNVPSVRLNLHVTSDTPSLNNYSNGTSSSSTSSSSSSSSSSSVSSSSSSNNTNSSNKNTSPQIESINFEMSADKFRVFYAELKAARTIMESIQ